MYLKKKFDIEEFQHMQKLGEYGYCKYLARRFGFYNECKDWYTYRTINEDNSLETYLDNHIGVVMKQLKDRKELISRANVRINGKLLKGIDSINTAFEERGINYRIEITKTSEMINGKQKRYPNGWVLVKTS